MIGLLQRVSEAKVIVEGRVVGEIGPGLLVFVGVEQGDDESAADRLLARLLGYRVFGDEAGRMNRSLQGVGGGFCWSPSSPLPPIRRMAPGPAFPRPPHPTRVGGCSTIW